MTGFIIIDTNIYRQLGIKFFEHIDYKNIENFIYASGFELAISEVVAKEYLDFYRNEVVENKISNLLKSIEALNSNPYLSKIKIPELEKRKTKAIKEFEEKLYLPKFKIPTPHIDSEYFLDFLIQNKNLKDSSRDYLIWQSIVHFAKMRSEDKICFITSDKIFKDNSSLSNKIDEKILKRIEIYDSISDFLHKNGFKVDFINKSFLEKNIDFSAIRKELFKRPTDILSYISIDYWHFKGKAKIISKAIEYEKVDKFYTYVDPEDSKLKYLAHIIIRPIIVFDIAKDYKPDFSKFQDWEISFGSHSPKTYDEKGNPVYKEEILFLIGGEIDDINKTIKNQDVYDFFLDYYKGFY